MIRVLVVDDQEIARHGLQLILKHEAGIEVIGTARNGQEALELVDQMRPDVALMDLKMPVLNGIQATRQIGEKYPQVKVLVLTTYDADEWVFDAIRAGACGYLLKDSEGAEIVRAVRGAVTGEVRIDPAVAGRVLKEFKRATAAAADPGALHDPAGAGSPRSPGAAGEAPGRAGRPSYESLTERELTVLQEMAQGRSNRQIAERLYLAEGTVRNHVSTIIAKLQANDRTEAAILALKRGLARLEP